MSRLGLSWFRFVAVVLASALVLVISGCSTSGEVVLSTPLPTATPAPQPEAGPASPEPLPSVAEPTVPAAPSPSVAPPTPAPTAPTAPTTAPAPTASPSPAVTPTSQPSDAGRSGSAQIVSVPGQGTVEVPFPATAGEWIDITVAPTDEVLDVVVDVLDPSGASILIDGAVDRAYATEFLRALRIGQTGTYHVALSGFDGSSGDAEVVVDESLDGLAGSLLRGFDERTDPDDTHLFPFVPSAGDEVSFWVHPFDVTHDVVLRLVDAETNEVLDEVDATTGFEELTFLAPLDRRYAFEVSGFEGSTGEYEFTLIAPETTIPEIALGDRIEGRFGDLGALSFTFNFFDPTTIAFEAVGDDDTNLLLRLLDDVATEVATADAVFSGTETLVTDVEADTPYVLEVQRLSGGDLLDLLVLPG